MTSPPAAVATASAEPSDASAGEILESDKGADAVEKSKPNKVPIASISELYQFTDGAEKTMLIIAFVCALGAGVAQDADLQDGRAAILEVEVLKEKLQQAALQLH